MDKLDTILARYFSGEATEQELHELDVWIAESEENEKYFMEMTMLFQKVSPRPQSDFNAEDALEGFQKHIYKDVPILKAKKKDRIRIRYWSAAAILLLIVAFALFLTNNNEKEIVVLADNQIKEVTYSENINITLNQNSILEYQKDALNEVKLTGEATFIVNSEEEKSEFIVYAGKTIIKDIGTIFTVVANEDDNFVSVSVEEGEVLFFTEENAGISIKENEIGKYYKLEKRFELISQNIDLQPSLEIVFQAQTLKDVAMILEKIFDVIIDIEDKSLENILLTAHFEFDEPLDLILNIIAETLSIKITKSENAYKITK